jgi:hypothetical protein
MVMNKRTMPMMLLASAVEVSSKMGWVEKSNYAYIPAVMNDSRRSPEVVRTYQPITS